MFTTKFCGLLLTVSGVAAWAQTNPPLSCSAGAANPPLMRSQSATEMIGDIVIICNGGTTTPAGSPVPTYTITITLNIPVTSRAFTRNLSEALLIVDEAFPAKANPPSAPQPIQAGQPQNFCRAVSATGCQIVGTGKPTGDPGGDYDGGSGHYNVFEGFVSGQYSISFVGVPVDAPGPGGSPIGLRITNVRADASQIPMPSIFSLNPVSVFISTPLVSNATIVDGYVTNGLTVTQTTPSPVPGTSFSSFSITFTEGFASVFRARTFYKTAGPQNVPGFAYNSESGLWDKLTAPDGLAPFGLADHGTRLMVHFSGYAPGTKIVVPSSNYLVDANATTSKTGGAAYVATDANGNSSGGPVAPASNTVVLTADSQGNAWAAYEVVKSDPNTVESLTIPVIARSQVVGSVRGSFAPLVTAGSTVIPRFVER